MHVHTCLHTHVPHQSLLGVGPGIEAGAHSSNDQVCNQVTVSAAKSNFSQILAPPKIICYAVQVATLHTVVSQRRYTHSQLLPQFPVVVPGYCPLWDFPIL